jgi:hypothetical protein
MKRFVFLTVLLLIGVILSAQTNSKQWTEIKDARRAGMQFTSHSVFTYLSDLEPSMREIASDGALLMLNHTKLQAMVEAAPTAVIMDIPYMGGTPITVELIPNRVVTEDFLVTLSSLDGAPTYYKPGLYFKGVIAGDPGSTVAISFFDNQVIGILNSTVYGTMELGALDQDAKGRYVLYRAETLRATHDFHCDGLEVDGCDHDHGDPNALPEADPNKCVRVYFECEYDMFVANGSSIQNTMNFMTSVYNVVALLYSNDGIQTAISEIFVWNTPDTYATGPSTSDALYSFRTKRPSFNGNVAHLVSRGAPSGGGVAWLNTLCGSYAYAYSYIYQSYSQFPTYSWTVNVITHEMGHNLGSNHTHDCVWDVSNNGIANEMIDGCGPAKGYSGGSCTVAPLPTNGGTIMSYCHLVSGVGINFSKGFGPLPAARIQSKVYNATCLSACSTCPINLSISKNDVNCFGTSTGSITVTAGGGTAPYSYAWSNNMSGNSISGLAAGIYTVTVTDNGSQCSKVESIQINQPTALSVTGVVSPEAMPGAYNGTIDITVTGGTAPYTYQWCTNAGSATTQDVTSLCGGTYSITVTDNKLCASSKVFTVTSNSCSNQISQFPHTESFETGLGLWTQATNDNFDWTRNSGGTPTGKTGPTSAASGSYYMYTEATGNSGTAYLESPCLNFTGATGATVEFFFHMYGSTMGTLALQVSTNNGASWSTIYSQSGNKGASWLLASVPLSQSYLTAYTKIRFAGTLGSNQTSDMAIDGITILTTAPPCTPPSLSTSGTNLLCNGGNTGTASVTAQGGTPGYSYLWSNNAITSGISGLTAGTYTVTVTDAANCSATASVTITQPAPIQQTFVITPATPGMSDGSVSRSVSGGTSPYDCDWCVLQNSFNLTGVATGTYTAYVTDANLCTVSQPVFVPTASSCAVTVNNFPYAESFESGTGLWTQPTTDNFDWTNYSGSTPTKNTGPTSAAPGAGTKYMYIECDGNSGIAYLESPCFDITALSNPTLSFAYHMYGNNMGTMTLEYSTDNGTTWNPFWSKTGNQTNTWLTQSLSLTTCQASIITLRFTGSVGGMRGDMAIDNIQITGTQAMAESVNTLPEESWTWTSLYPNPASTQMTLRIFAETETEVQVYLSDALGRKFHMGDASLAPGENNIAFPLEGFSAGVYYITAGTGKVQMTKMLLIKP